MVAVLTCWGLSVLRCGTCAPLWRQIVTPDNAIPLNWIAAFIVAFCLAYSVYKLVFAWLTDENADRSGKCVSFSPVLVGLSLFVVPAFAEQLAGLSPFFFSLMPSALSLAVLMSLNEKTTSQMPNDEERTPPRRFVDLRLFVSGTFASVAVWEGTLGLVVSVVTLFLVFLPCLGRKGRLSEVLFVWFSGFTVAFFAEGIALEWPWQVLHPSRFPVLGVAVFIIVGLLPAFAARRLGTKLMVVWVLVLVAMTADALIHGRYWQVSGCELFARKVLSDLGARKLIVGDGFTDDFFRELKPADVKFVGSRTLADREFLISFFGTNESVTNRALFVSHYYKIPEMKDAAAELGLTLRASEKPTVRTPTALAQAATNEQRRLEKIAQPVLQSIKELTSNFTQIPVSQRERKIDEARSKIRRGWANGLTGADWGSTLLTLDLLLGDWAAAESDALTALMINREDAAANALLGNIRLRKGELDNAERYLRKGVKGGGIGAYNDLAVVLVKTGRAAEAETWARKAVESAPRDWIVRETLVQVLLELGRSSEAKAELDMVERIARARNQSGLAKEALERDRARLRSK